MYDAWIFRIKWHLEVGPGLFCYYLFSDKKPVQTLPSPLPALHSIPTPFIYSRTINCATPFSLLPCVFCIVCCVILRPFTWLFAFARFQTGVLNPSRTLTYYTSVHSYIPNYWPVSWQNFLFKLFPFESAVLIFLYGTYTFKQLLSWRRQYFISSNVASSKLWIILLNMPF